MSILFDTIRFHNPTHEGEKGPIVAEVGVVVNSFPPSYTDEEGNQIFVDLPMNVEPGYYYVTMVSRSKKIGGIGIDGSEKKYIVSEESIFEYIYGFADENDPPKYIESYDRIEDAVNSEFLSFFLLMNKLIDDSRYDPTIKNSECRKSRMISEIETTVQINCVDEWVVVSKALIADKPHSELCCEIVLNEKQGMAMCINDEIHLLSHCCFKEISGQEIQESYLTLDRACGSVNFSDYVRLKKATEEYLITYFEKEKAVLEKRFSEKEISALKTGILGVALGLQEYQS